MEQQAQDRIHRLGQFKAMRVTRFVIGSTIEERILKLQEKKQLVRDARARVPRGKGEQHEWTDLQGGMLAQARACGPAMSSSTHAHRRAAGV